MAYNLKHKRKKIHSAKWDRCVEDVEEKGTAYNPYAVCTSKLKKKSFR